jgi:O-acetyl-ADP-ribose deacetylase (regulator of RNase III)
MNTLHGNLITLAKEGQFDIIVHGCNCYNSMGNGIAKSIKLAFPEAFIKDCQTVKGDKNKLGTFTHIHTVNDIGRELIVVNAYTQFQFWGLKDGQKDLFEYEHFETILHQLNTQFKDKSFGFPLIGCGLAHGNEQRILSMIDNVLGQRATIVRFNG